MADPQRAEHADLMARVAKLERQMAALQPPKPKKPDQTPKE